MILFENIKPIEHVLLRLVCAVSHLMCACKHCNVKLFLYYWTHWSCWWIYHFKKHIFNAIFHNQSETSGRLKKQIWVKKKLRESPGYMRKTPITVTW